MYHLSIAELEEERKLAVKRGDYHKKKFELVSKEEGGQEQNRHEENGDNGDSVAVDGPMRTQAAETSRPSPPASLNLNPSTTKFLAPLIDMMWRNGEGLYNLGF